MRFFFVFIFRNLLWGSVNYGQSLHGLHNTKSLRTPGLWHLSPLACTMGHTAAFAVNPALVACQWQHYL